MPNLRLPFVPKSLFNSPQRPGPYHFLFDAFGNPVDGIISRLPQHYLNQIKPVRPPNLNWEPPSSEKFIRTKGRGSIQKERIRKQATDIPIPVVYPARSRQELWGGEGLIFGYTKRSDAWKCVATRHIWRPYLLHRTLHSEILDRPIETVVSATTLDHIDEHFGFDSYILETPPHLLQSEFGMKLKGEMLVCLAKKCYYPDNPEMHRMISEKYKDHVIDLEIAEWVGLTPLEAVFKQQLAESAGKYRPKKEILLDELLKKLSMPDDEFQKMLAEEDKALSS